MPKHTPGPWTAKEVGNNWLIETGPDGAGFIIPGYPDEMGANAKLIAAAPELLVALKWFIDDIDGTHTVMVEFDADVARARAAIAKATV